MRIIRVFISSTFTDTAQERNLLIADGNSRLSVDVIVALNRTDENCYFKWRAHSGFMGDAVR